MELSPKNSLLAYGKNPAKLSKYIKIGLANPDLQYSTLEPRTKKAIYSA